MVAVAGIDVFGYLHAEPFEQLVILAAAERTIELRHRDRENLAVLIANRVGEAFGGG